jgi:hypothetical protein
MNTLLRRSGARTRSASLLLAALVLGSGLTACGSDGTTATDPASSAEESPSESPSETPAESPTEDPSESTEPPSDGTSEPAAGDPQQIPATGSAGVTEAWLVSATEGGGSESTLAFALDTEQAVADFTAVLEAGLPDRVTSAVREVAEASPDRIPYGAVVSVGCEAPRAVAVDQGEAGYEVVPRLPKSSVQCLAPVTHVVVFAG